MTTQHKAALITGITGQDGSYLADTSNLVRMQWLAAGINTFALFGQKL